MPYFLDFRLKIGPKRLRQASLIFAVLHRFWAMHNLIWLSEQCFLIARSIKYSLQTIVLFFRSQHVSIHMTL